MAWWNLKGLVSGWLYRWKLRRDSFNSGKAPSEVLGALAQIGDPLAVPVMVSQLRSALEDRHRETTAIRLIEALGELKDARAVEPILVQVQPQMRPQASRGFRLGSLVPTGWLLFCSARGGGEQAAHILCPSPLARPFLQHHLAGL